MLTRRIVLFSALFLAPCAVAQEAAPTKIAVIQTENSVQLTPATEQPTDTPDVAGVTYHTISVGGEEAQVVRTKWKSGGIDQEVETKVSGSEEGRKLALIRHDKLVVLMKEYYPPDP